MNTCSGSFDSWCRRRPSQFNEAVVGTQFYSSQDEPDESRRNLQYSLEIDPAAL